VHTEEQVEKHAQNNRQRNKAPAEQKVEHPDAPGGAVGGAHAHGNIFAGQDRVVGMANGCLVVDLAVVHRWPFIAARDTVRSLTVEEYRNTHLGSKGKSTGRPVTPYQAFLVGFGPKIPRSGQ